MDELDAAAVGFGALGAGLGLQRPLEIVDERAADRGRDPPRRDSAIALAVALDPLAVVVELGGLAQQTDRSSRRAAAGARRRPRSRRPRRRLRRSRGSLRSLLSFMVPVECQSGLMSRSQPAGGPHVVTDLVCDDPADFADRRDRLSTALMARE